MKETYGVRFNINGRGLFTRPYQERHLTGGVYSFPIDSNLDLSKVKELIGLRTKLHGTITADCLEIVLLRGEATPLSKWRELVFKECDIVNVRKWSELEEYAKDTGKSLKEIDLLSFMLDEHSGNTHDKCLQSIREG